MREKSSLTSGSWLNTDRPSYAPDEHKQLYKTSTSDKASPWSYVRVCSFPQSCPGLCGPKDFSPPGTIHHGDSPGKNLDKNKISQKSYLNTEKSLNNFHTRTKSSALLPGKTSGSMVKNPSAKQEMWLLSLAQEDPWRRKWQPSPVFLPGKSHGQRSLVGNSPWSPRVRHDLHHHHHHHHCDPCVLANMCDCYFFTSYNHYLTLFFSPSRKDLLKWSVIEISLLPDITQCRVKPHFHKPFSNQEQRPKSYSNPSVIPSY